VNQPRIVFFFLANHRIFLQIEDHYGGTFVIGTTWYALLRKNGLMKKMMLAA
jgi:hypothetical protein